MDQANNVSQYLKLLGKYNDYEEIYFRGQSEEYKTITPSIIRDNGYLENEGLIFNEATTMKYDEFIKLSTPIQKLSKMQHYGIPTRLIDLSTDPLISLYFAVEDIYSKYPGNIYVYVRKGNNFDDLNVKILSLLATLSDYSIPNIIDSYKKEFGEYITKEQILDAVKKPVFIKPCEELNKSNIRLYNQHGTFAICGNNITSEIITKQIKSIETITPTMIIRIPYEYKARIKQELDEKYNINKTKVYPELPSVASYLKEKYKESNFNPNRKFTIVKKENVSHAKAKRLSLTVVLSTELTIDEIKKVAIKIIEENKNCNDVIWIYIAKNGEDYIMTNWILQGQWISHNLDKNYRPLEIGTLDSNGYYWLENKSYSVQSDFNSKYIFEDDVTLYVCNQKIYNEIQPIFNELFLAIKNDTVKRISDLIKKNKIKINTAFMQLGNFGHSRNKDFDDFLYTYTDAISTMDNLHYWIENDTLNESELKIELAKCINSAKKLFSEIDISSLYWYKKLNISQNEYDNIDPYNRLQLEYQYKQTIPISQDAILVTFNAKATINEDNTVIISATTNLFDNANLMISIYNSSNMLMGRSHVDVLYEKFKSEVYSFEGNIYQVGIYTVEFILSIPSTQKKSFTKLAGIEYENLTGPYVNRTGIGPTVIYNFNFSID